MIHKEFTLKSVDRLNLYGQYWAPEKMVKGAVCLVHGHGEHSLRYEPWAAHFTGRGYAVVTFDLRGHGLSEGKKGHAPSYLRLMEDIDLLVHRTREYFPEVPVFLYGHSMGGNLVLGYAVGRSLQMAGVVSTSPWLRLKNELPGVVMIPVRGLSKIAPAMTIHTRLDAAGISHDQEVVKKYVEDPLNHDIISLRLFFEIHDAGLRLIREGGAVNVPVLVVHGSDDPITDPEGSRLFVGKAKGDVTLKIFNGLYHETHNEPGKEKVFEYINNWMAKRIK